MLIEGIVAIRRSATNYGRQQYYADRSAQLALRRPSQYGLVDKVHISIEAVNKMNKISAQAAPKPPGVTYNDPRKTIPYHKRQKPPPATFVDISFTAKEVEVKADVNTNDEFVEGLAFAAAQ